MENKLTYEYIRGLIEGEGCFTFCKIGKYQKIPAFAIGMNERDKELLHLVKDTMGLRNRIYQYPPRIRKDGYKRDGMCILTVRDFGQLKNIIIPFFYKRLRGNKGKQFNQWLDNIGNDPKISEHFRFLYKLHKSGFYDKNPKFE